MVDHWFFVWEKQRRIWCFRYIWAMYFSLYIQAIFKHCTVAYITGVCLKHLNKYSYQILWPTIVAHNLVGDRTSYHTCYWYPEIQYYLSPFIISMNLFYVTHPSCSKFLEYSCYGWKSTAPEYIGWNISPSFIYSIKFSFALPKQEKKHVFVREYLRTSMSYGIEVSHTKL